jgi:hypothetical protein
MHRSIVIAALFSTQVSVALASVAADVIGRNQDPDWPCIQRKVPELSAAAVWEGPPIEETADRWRDDAEVVALVEQIAARRMSLEDAEAAIAAFGGGLDAAERQARLTLVFAGLFETLDQERSDVIAGIERYGRRQKTLAEQIRAERAELSELSAAATAAADAQRAAELENRLLWETRIFNERRNSLAFVCEVPTLIEQRLFVLARAIQRSMTSDQ